MEEILSKSTIGLRKVGISTLAVAMSLGVAGVTAGAANAADGTLTGPANPPHVTQGLSNQAAGDVSYEFVNNFQTNSTITFTVGDANAPSTDPNNCATQAGIDSAVGFSAKPTVGLTTTDGNNNGQSARIPSYTITMGSVDPTCATVGIQDKVTITLTQPSSGDAADDLVLDLSDIAYNVGKSAGVGNVTVHAAAVGTTTPNPASVTNAVVVNKSFMFVPRTSAEPSTTGNALGTGTYSESTPGAYFAAGDNTVTLTLAGATFTAGVKPTITVPSGYTVSSATGGNDGAPTTTAGATYVFHVTAPNPLPSTPATLTISGLEADAPGAVGTATLTSAVKQGAAGPTSTDTAQVLNVVNQARTGGDDRYSTAANLFNGEFGNNVNSVVLSGGELFPDALSANYLAGELGTGTLLTRAGQLSQPARQAIIDNYISRVYITGGTAAVSQAVQDELTSMHVGDNPNGSFIQVIRLGGANRYETNAKINRNNLSAHNTVVMAAGTAPYDSLAVGPIVYNNSNNNNGNQYPLILTNGSNLNNGEVSQLNDFGAQNIVIVGGTAVVSQAVQDELVKDGYNVVRVAGATRYETAADIATWATEGFDANGDGNTSNDGVVDSAQGFTSTETNITNGLGFADALSAGPVAGSEGEPVLLAQNTNTVGSALASYLGGKTVGNTAGDIATLRALGLTAATSNSMMKDAAADIG